MPTFKRTSNFLGTYPREVWYALGVMDGVSREFLGHPIIITSMNDGQHMVGSLHLKNLAFDVRTRDLTIGEVSELLSKVKAILDPQGYDTIWEDATTPGSSGTHLHCEYDPKAGEIFITITD